MDRVRERRFGGRGLAMGIAGLFAAAVAVRLLLAQRWTGFYSDQRLFVQWWETIEQYGVAGAYARNAGINYPPLYLWLLEGYGKLIGLFGWTPEVGKLSYKMLPLCIDLAALAAAVRLTTGMRAAWRFPLLALFALNPALLIDGVVWGQIDMLHGMLMVLAAATIARRPWLSGLCMALALLTKLQAIAIAPVLGAYLLARWAETRRPQPLLQWAAAFLLPLLAVAAYFGAAGSLGSLYRQAYADAVGEYAYASMNAFNLWFHVAGIPPSAPDTAQAVGFLTYRGLGLCLFGLAALLVCACVFVACRRGRPPAAALMKAGAAINLAFFLLPTEIHERYSIPALLFAIFAAAYDRRWLAPALTLTAAVAVNLAAVLRMSGGRQRFDFGGAGGARGAGGLPGSGALPGGSLRLPFGGGPGWRQMPGSAAGGGFRPGGAAGFGASLPASYAWVAAVNLALLLVLFWLLWRETRRAQDVPAQSRFSSKNSHSPRE